MIVKQQKSLNYLTTLEGCVCVEGTTQLDSLVFQVSHLELEFHMIRHLATFQRHLQFG